jgi:hypothetical protein
LSRDFGKVFQKNFDLPLPSLKRIVVDLQPLKVSNLEIGLGNVAKGSPGGGSLHSLTCGVARLNLADVLAIGKINNTLELMNHKYYLSFFSLHIYYTTRATKSQ